MKEEKNEMELKEKITKVAEEELDKVAGGFKVVPHPPNCTCDLCRPDLMRARKRIGKK